jgi:hypothetical protein
VPDTPDDERLAAYLAEFEFIREGLRKISMSGKYSLASR